MQPERLLTKPFVLTMLAEFALCMSIGMLLAVVPVYAHDDLGVGSFGVALAVAAVSPMVLVCQPLAGRFGDRHGRKLLIVAGGAIAALAVAGYVVADSLPLLVALRLLTGAGEALLLVGAATMITDLAPEHRRGEALSLFSLGLWGGLALGPILGELVLGDDRFDAVWLFAAACCLASALIGLTLPETAPTREPDHHTTATARAPRCHRARRRALPSPSSGSRASGRSGRSTRASSVWTAPGPCSSCSRPSSSRRAFSRARCPIGSGPSARRGWRSRSSRQVS